MRAELRLLAAICTGLVLSVSSRRRGPGPQDGQPPRRQPGGRQRLPHRPPHRQHAAHSRRHRSARGGDLPSGRTGVVTIYGQRPAGNELAIIDIASGTVKRTISLGQYTRPHGVVFIPGDETRVVVTSESTGNVVIVNIEGGTVEAAIPTVAQGSHMAAITADGKRVFTSNVDVGQRLRDRPGRAEVRARDPGGAQGGGNRRDARRQASCSPAATPTAP